MTDDEVEWAGSFAQMPSTVGRGDMDAETCAFCEGRPAATSLDLGPGSMTKSWAVARWWPLCEECVQAGRSGPSNLMDRANSGLRELPMFEEIAQLVINALSEVPGAEQQSGR